MYENPVPNCFRGGDDWEYVITEKKERPTEKTAGFEGVKPEDLKKKTDLSEKMKVVLENLSEEPVEINGRKFVFIGDYDQYTRIASDGESEDANEKEEWDDWDDDDMDPWNDRECSHVIDNNIPETGLISLWLTPLGGKIRSITKTGDVGKADYVVVRLDPWAEDCIDIEKIRKAAASGIKIISEYQLWKAIFDSPSNEMSGKKEDNPDIDDFIIENGILKEYKGKARAIEVPEGVISIERDAFRGNKTMMKISLPEGLKYIGKKAFMGVTLKEIILPESLEELGDEVFTYCETLHSIRIPANVRALGDGVFNDCDLTEIIVDEANQYFTSVDGVLFSKDMNRLIVYPKAREDSKYVVPDTVREIGRVAFWQNRNLTEVVLPAGLESIGSAAFCWCKKLVIMDLPDSIKSIGFNALSNTKLKRVIVPGTMSIIESGVFSWNDSLKEAVISEGVTKISDYAFAGTGINEIAIPQSVTEIEHDAFCNCFSLKKAIVPGHIADPEKHFPNCEITVQG